MVGALKHTRKKSCLKVAAKTLAPLQESALDRPLKPLFKDGHAKLR